MENAAIMYKLQNPNFVSHIASVDYVKEIIAKCTSNVFQKENDIHVDKYRYAFEDAQTDLQKMLAEANSRPRIEVNSCRKEGSINAKFIERYWSKI